MVKTIHFMEKHSEESIKKGKEGKETRLINRLLK